MSEQHNNDGQHPPRRPAAKGTARGGRFDGRTSEQRRTSRTNPPVVGRNVAEAAPLNATGKGMSVTVAACHSAASPPAPHHSVAVPQTPPGW